MICTLTPEESRLAKLTTDLRLSRIELSCLPILGSARRAGNSSVPTDHVRIGGFGVRGVGLKSGLLDRRGINDPWLGGVTI